MGLKRILRKLTRRSRNRCETLPSKALRNADVIVTTNEVTDRHGT